MVIITYRRLNMKGFFVEHPFISLLMVSTICRAAVDITKIIKGEKVAPGVSLVINGSKKVNDVDEKTEEKKEETVKEA